MKTQRSIFIAFILNLIFSALELVGGMLIGSVAIISDAVHDAGDAAAIGISWALEKKSTRPPDGLHTYGYTRYSVLGSFFTTAILLLGSVGMIANGIHRLLQPTRIHYNGMILLAVAGVAVNFCAALFTHRGESLNQKAVNLHMLEDLLGWVAVLAGAIVMKLTGFRLLDPLICIGVSVFIFINALLSFRRIGNIFLEKAPMDAAKVRSQLLNIEGVADVHHIHIRSIDGSNHCATMHIVTNHPELKAKIRRVLHDLGIGHATLELEATGEVCADKYCRLHRRQCGCGHHHH